MLMKRHERYRRTYQAFHSMFSSFKRLSESLGALRSSTKGHAEPGKKAIDLRGLMIATQAGDSDAYRQLLSQVVNLLAQFYMTRLPAPLFGSAIRGALLTIHAVRHTYDPATPLEPWIYEIATLRYRDTHRTFRATPRPWRSTSRIQCCHQTNGNEYQ
jgi:hypothetical protein